MPFYLKAVDVVPEVAKFQSALIYRLKALLVHLEIICSSYIK